MDKNTASQVIKLGAKVILKLSGAGLLSDAGEFVYEMGKDYLPQATTGLIDSTVDTTVDFFADEVSDFAKGYLTTGEKYVNFHLARGICKVWENALTESLPKNRAANSKFVLLPQDSFQDFNEQLEFFIIKFKEAQEIGNEHLLIELFYDKERSEEGFYDTFFAGVHNEKTAEEAYWQTLYKTLRRWSIVAGKFRYDWKNDFPEDFKRELKKFLFGNLRLGLKEVFDENEKFRNAFIFSAQLLLIKSLQNLPNEIKAEIENAQSENRFNFSQIQEQLGDIKKTIRERFESALNPETVKRIDETTQESNELLKIILTILKNQPKSISLPKFIAAESLPTQTNYFTGRNEVIKNIEKTLKSHKRATLHGMSGLGKTSVALEFARRNAESYKHILFLRATKDDAVSGFAKLAEKMDETAKNLEKDSEKAALFKFWLEENDGWLLLIDNVDVPHEVRQLLPINLRGHILSTGNSNEIKVLGNEVKIKKMTSGNGELLLYRRAMTLSDLNDEEIKEKLKQETATEQIAVRNIVEEVDGLPLALNLAGAYIHKFNKSFADYENLFQTSANKLLEKQDINDQYQNDSVAKSFSLAFATIAKPENDSNEAKKIAETAILFLKTASFMNPEAIPLEIFKGILTKYCEDESDLSKDELFLDEVFAKIAQFDLFEIDSDKKTFDTHCLVQKVIFNKIEETEKQCVCTQILEILYTLFPVYDYYNKEVCEKFYKHIQNAFDCACQLKIQTEIPVNFYYRVGDYKKLLGEYKQAEQFHQLQYKISRVLYGEKHLSTATSMNCLGIIYDLQGKHKEALELYEKALKIIEEITGKNYFEYANNLNNLALVYQSQGKYAEAIEKLEEALRIDEITIGKEHVNYAIRLGNLGQIYIGQGNLEMAIKLQEETLAIFEKTVGKKHPHYAICLNDLAVAFQMQGKYLEAVRKLEEALRIDEITIGKTHPEYATRLGNLANVLLLQGKFTQAIKLYEKALWIDGITIGKQHPEYSTRLGNLANIYFLQGKYVKAIKLYEEALWVDEITVGKTHPEYATRLSNLANIFYVQNKFDAALDLYEEALSVDEKVLPENHPYTKQDTERIVKCREKMANRKSNIAIKTKTKRTRPRNNKKTLEI